MNNDNIKKDNKKAIIKFVLFTLFCMLCGGIAGYLTSFIDFKGNIKNEVHNTINIILQFVSDWGILVLFFCIMIPCVYLYLNAKRMYQNMVEEDEFLFDKIETKLSYVMLLLNIMYVFLLFIINCIMIYENRNMIFKVIEIIAVFVIFVYMEQKVIDFTKILNPEKKGSVYDLNFRKKWFDSCDEAERFHIGNASYQAYIITNMACIILWLILIFMQNIFEIGLLPSCIVLIILVILNCSYIIASIKDSKK